MELKFSILLETVLLTILPPTTRLYYFLLIILHLACFRSHFAFMALISLCALQTMLLHPFQCFVQILDSKGKGAHRLDLLFIQF